MKTLTLCLIGHNIGNSLSPCIHQAFIDLMGVPARYILCDTDRDADLAGAVAQLESGHIHGINVTTPYKVKGTEYCQALSTGARRCGAVNTLYMHKGVVNGALTDLEGFVRALKFHQIKGTSALVLGSGGAARAVVAGLVDSGYETIHVHARNHATARALQDIFPFVKAFEPGQPVDLVINATPLSGQAIAHFLPGPVGDILKPGGAFFDLNYQGRTVGMQLAINTGRRGINGLAMLVFQAALAWRLWFGVDLSEAINVKNTIQRCGHAQD